MAEPGIPEPPPEPTDPLELAKFIAARILARAVGAGGLADRTARVGSGPHQRVTRTQVGRRSSPEDFPGSSSAGQERRRESGYLMLRADGVTGCPLRGGPAAPLRGATGQGWRS